MAAHFDSLANEDGVFIEGPEEIHDAAVSFFSRLLSFESHNIHTGILELIPSLVTDDESRALLLDFSMEELKEAVFSIPTDSSPRLDGFSVTFFTSSWSLIGGDLLSAMNEVLRMDEFPLYLTHTAIALLLRNIPSRHYRISGLLVFA